MRPEKSGDEILIWGRAAQLAWGDISYGRIIHALV